MRLYIRPVPVPGEVVVDWRYPHPVVPTEGMWVEWHPYWSRKLARGSVVLDDAAPAAPPAPVDEPPVVAVPEPKPVKRKNKEA